MDILENLRLMRLRTAVLVARSREVRARASRTCEHARLLQQDSADLQKSADGVRDTKPPHS
jgi:hypothetical protein